MGSVWMVKRNKSNCNPALNISYGILYTATDRHSFLNYWDKISNLGRFLEYKIQCSYINGQYAYKDDVHKTHHNGGLKRRSF